jgi:D-glycero-beta-D-manno-heptose-7-phosphate kinase
MDAQAIFARFPDLRILVIGDVMLDHYIFGDVHRISPEAPVPVVAVTRESHVAGGAANVAMNLAALGVRAELLSVFGQDAAGDQLAHLCREHQINLAYSLRRAETPTILKTRVLARSQQMCRIDREAAKSLYTLQHLPDLEFRLRAALKGCAAVIVSDYAKGTIIQTTYDLIRQIAREQNVLLAVDPKPNRPFDWSGADLITPNRSEALQLANQCAAAELPDDASLAEIAHRIHENCAPKWLVVTLGAEGMALCQNGTVQQHIPTRAREVFDVSGAGDTVIATLTAALAAGGPPDQAVQLANAAAGVVVSKIGTASTSPNEVLALINTL